MTDTVKPRVFIGSSSEGLGFAGAVCLALEKDAEITKWDEGFFPLGVTFIEALFKNSSQFHFAVLVLSLDDIVISREVESFGPRDNVLFELGLFMGRLGRLRTFIIYPDTPKLKIPTDLSGVTMAAYQWPRSDKNYEAAVTSACYKIRNQIKTQGRPGIKAEYEILSPDDLRIKETVTEETIENGAQLLKPKPEANFTTHVYVNASQPIEVLERGFAIHVMSNISKNVHYTYLFTLHDENADSIAVMIFNLCAASELDLSSNLRTLIDRLKIHITEESYGIQYCILNAGNEDNAHCYLRHPEKTPLIQWLDWCDRHQAFVMAERVRKLCPDRAKEKGRIIRSTTSCSVYVNPNKKVSNFMTRLYEGFARLTNSDKTKISDYLGACIGDAMACKLLSQADPAAGLRRERHQKD